MYFEYGGALRTYLPTNYIRRKKVLCFAQYLKLPIDAHWVNTIFEGTEY